MEGLKEEQMDGVFWGPTSQEEKVYHGMNRKCAVVSNKHEQIQYNKISDLEAPVAFCCLQNGS